MLRGAVRKSRSDSQWSARWPRFLRESQKVSGGTLLAELQNRSQIYQVALSAAEVAIARAQLERLRNGERAEKRKAMAAIEEAKHALLRQAKATYSHSQKLRERHAVGEEEARSGLPDDGTSPGRV